MISNRFSLILILFLAASPLAAQSWLSSPGSGDWNTASNWTPAVIPNSTSAQVVFNSSSVTQISISADVDVADITMNSLAANYSLDIGSHALNLWGIGINTNGGTPLTVTGSGLVALHNSATAFYSTIHLQSGGRLVLADNAHGLGDVELDSGSSLDISQLSSTSAYVTSLQGSGSVSLGSRDLHLGGATTFSGNFSDGGLGGGTGGTLSTDGDILLTGNNTYSGGTSILDGYLRVGSSGALGSGSLFNSGTLTTGNGPQTILVQGDYTMGTFSVLRLGLGGVSEGQYDRLLVAGDAHVTWQLEIFSQNAFQPQPGDTFTLLTAQAVDGDFYIGIVNPFAGTRFRLEYFPQEILLQTLPLSFESYAVGANEKAFARALDVQYENRTLDGLITSIIALPTSSYDGAYHLAAPEELTALYRIGFTDMDSVLDSMDWRLANIRGVGNSLVPNQTSASSSNSPSEGQVFLNGKTLEKDRPWDALIGGDGNSVKIKGDGDAAGYDLTTSNLSLAGVNYDFGKNLFGGGFLGYSRSDARLENGGTVQANGGRFGLYVDWFLEGVHLDFIACGLLNFYDSQWLGLGGGVTAHSNGIFFAGSWGGGYEWRLGDLTLDPFGIFRFENGQLGPIQPNHPDYSLGVSAQSMDSFSTQLGIKAKLNLKLGGVRLSPRGEMAWRHEYLKDGDLLKLDIQEYSNSQFQVAGPRMGRDYLALRSGLSVDWTERMFSYVEYRVDLGWVNVESEGLAFGTSFGF